MKNIEYLQSLKKKLSIPNWICRILVLPSIILIGITAPKSTTLATIFTILTTIFIITGLILDKKIKQLIF